MRCPNAPMVENQSLYSGPYIISCALFFKENHQFQWMEISLFILAFSFNLISLKINWSDRIYIMRFNKLANWVYIFSLNKPG